MAEQKETEVLFRCRMKDMNFLRVTPFGYATSQVMVGGQVFLLSEGQLAELSDGQRALFEILGEYDPDDGEG
jgi:hypothetical protein